jgi:NADH-quinone oxidoreductase subunit N
MLAYSSIAHAGYLLVALAAGTNLGAAAFLFYLVVYTLMTFGSFAVVMVVAGRGEGRINIGSYSGIAWQNPFIGVIMTVFLLSLAGFPLTGGFIGKVFILRAAIDRGLIALSVALVLTSLLSYYYYLRVAWYMWFREADDDGRVPIVLTPALKAALVIAAVGVVALGVLPGRLLDGAQRSAASLVPAAAADSAMSATGR